MSVTWHAVSHLIFIKFCHLINLCILHFPKSKVSNASDFNYKLQIIK